MVGISPGCREIKPGVNATLPIYMGFSSHMCECSWIPTFLAGVPKKLIQIKLILVKHLFGSSRSMTLFTYSLPRILTIGLNIERLSKFPPFPHLMKPVACRIPSLKCGIVHCFSLILINQNGSWAPCKHTHNDEKEDKKEVKTNTVKREAPSIRKRGTTN